MMLKWISENYKKILTGLSFFIIMLGICYLKYQYSKIESLESDIKSLRIENENNKNRIDILTNEYQKISNAIGLFEKKDQDIQNKVRKNNTSIKKTIGAIKSDNSNKKENLNKFNELNKNLMQELMSVGDKNIYSGT